MKIRRATIDDLEAVRDLNHQLFLYDKQFNPTWDTEWPMSKEGEEYYRYSISKKIAAVS